MKKRPIYFALFPALFLILSTSGCKKEKEIAEPPTATKTKTELITSGKWKIISAWITDPNDPDAEPVDALAAANLPCIDDNLYIFKKNGKGDIEEGATKCNPNDTDIAYDDFTWSFADNETILLMDGSIDTIKVLHASSLKTVTSFSGPGGSLNLEVTYANY